MYEVVEKIVRESWLVLGQMAPYLLFGFLVAGILSVCVSPAWVERHLGKRGWGPVLAASLFGVPLPLCSCGVIPVSASLRRHGASRAATTAFLLSTPQTGVDSIAITYGMLGPVFAIFRPIAALLTGLVGGGLVQMLDKADGSNAAAESKTAACTQSCCDASSSQNVVFRVLRYGFVVLPRDIGAALLIGVLIAGVISAFVDPGQWKTYLGSGTFSILLLMAAGVPVYVCATASVPIAAGLIHIGASPGAALAFLIAGPATNAAAFATIWKLLGRRTAGVYLLTVAVSALACGLLLNQFIPTAMAARPPLGSHVHEATEVHWMSHLWAIALLAVMGLSSKTLARWAADSRRAKGEPDADDSSGPDRVELAVVGMSCSHCAGSVRRALAECDGVSSAEVNLSSGRAVVTGHRLDPHQLAATVAELGYAAKLPE